MKHTLAVRIPEAQTGPRWSQYPAAGWEAQRFGKSDGNGAPCLFGKQVALYGACEFESRTFRFSSIILVICVT